MLPPTAPPRPFCQDTPPHSPMTPPGTSMARILKTPPVISIRQTLLDYGKTPSDYGKTPLDYGKTPPLLLPTSRAPRDGGLPALVRKNIPSAQWTFIESASTGSGIPDAEFCFENGIQGWLELKATGAWSVRFRPEQPGWLMRRSRLGGRAYILVRRAQVELWLVRGADAGVLQSQGLRAVEPAFRTVGGPGAWDWRGLEAALKI
jgi:hypothetical protein